jgi:hypothetical protein
LRRKRLTKACREADNYDDDDDDGGGGDDGDEKRS